MSEIIEVIKNAWERLDPDLLDSVLSEDCEWHETPFSEPLVGAKNVIGQWKKDIAGQSNVSFEYEDVAKEDNKQVFIWTCLWREDGHNRKLNGVFYLVTKPNGKLSLFRQWYAS